MSNILNKISQHSAFGSKLGLERIKNLLDALGNPEKDIPVIHVAGTNGKGSVCQMIYQTLKEGGYKVGLYTSPYLEVFNERIEFDGQQITDKELEIYGNMVIEKSEELTSKGMERPTEFEMITALSFLFFSKKPIDFLVLEVGLGGRGDSTNVVSNPLVSIITSISYDHTDRLGNTLEEIAYEKAGIIKQGVPVVSNVEKREAAKVIAKEAYGKNSVFVDASRLKPRIETFGLEGQSFSVDFQNNQFGKIPLAMLGEHQVENGVTALAAIEILREKGIINIGKKHLYEGFSKAKKKGRMEIIDQDPFVVIDGAHNPEGMECLIQAVKDYFNDKKILTVIGLLGDKDVDGILDFAQYLGESFIATEPEDPRKYEGRKLGENLRERGKDCKVISHVDQAIDFVKKNKDPWDVVLFVGSLHLIGEVRKRW